MKQVKDTSETMWNVYDVLYANDLIKSIPTMYR